MGAMGTTTYNPSTWETEAEGLTRPKGQPGLPRKTLSQKKKKKRKEKKKKGRKEQGFSFSFFLFWWY
jgi:hypothetical protein